MSFFWSIWESGGKNKDPIQQHQPVVQLSQSVRIDLFKVQVFQAGHKLFGFHVEEFELVEHEIVSFSGTVLTDQLSLVVFFLGHPAPSGPPRRCVSG